MRKTAPLILTFFLVISCLFGQSPTVQVQDTTALTSADTVDVAITYSSPDTIAPIAFQGAVQYDASALQVDTVFPGSAIAEWPLSAARISQDTIFFGSAGTVGDSTDGPIARVRFQIQTDQPGTYSITPTYALADTDTVQTVGGAITLRSPLAGDVNQDGQVTLADAREILQYVIGAPVEWTAWQRQIADVDQNGVVQAHDVSQTLDSL